VGAEGDVVVPPRRYTEEQFRAAVADPEVRTLADLCRALGLVPRGANYETVRAYGRELGMDVDHELAGRRPSAAAARRGRATRYSDEQLLSALEDPHIEGYRALCEALDLRPNSNTYQRLRRRALALGVRIPASWSTSGPRPSLRRTYAQDALRDAVAGATTIADVIRALGERPSKSTYNKVHRSFEAHAIDTSHISGPNRAPRAPRVPLEAYIVEGRRGSSRWLKLRLIREGWLKRACSHCTRTTWEGRAIPLELDHIDGNPTNNLFENLRLLCPNCHALTPTYRGKNIGRGRAGLENS
jgi:beta-phosphoglucomutase-like phosphatase (HAD superfamily)